MACCLCGRSGFSGKLHPLRKNRLGGYALKLTVTQPAWKRVACSTCFRANAKLCKGLHIAPKKLRDEGIGSDDDPDLSGAGALGGLTAESTPGPAPPVLLSLVSRKTEKRSASDLSSTVARSLSGGRARSLDPAVDVEAAAQHAAKRERLNQSAERELVGARLAALADAASEASLGWSDDEAASSTLVLGSREASPGASGGRGRASIDWTVPQSPPGIGAALQAVAPPALQDQLALRTPLDLLAASAGAPDATVASAAVAAAAEALRLGRALLNDPADVLRRAEALQQHFAVLRHESDVLLLEQEQLFNRLRQIDTARQRNSSACTLARELLTGFDLQLSKLSA